MHITFIGAAHEVTGSCTLLEAAGKHILIDCGLEQGPDIYENCDFPLTPGEIDAICLTHAHIDHSGKLPYLVANGFTGPIHSTGATNQLCNIMLRDSAHIQEFEAQWRNRKAKRAAREQYVPLYTMADVEKTLPLFQPHHYDEEVNIFDSITIRFTDNGHLLGSSNILFTINENGIEKTILFSGDIGNNERPLLRNPQIPPKAEYVVIESTYGDRNHGPRPEYIDQLIDILQDTFRRGGNLVIPSFAVGRTQELLYLIHEIKNQHLLPEFEDFPVVVDSPLAVEATQIYNSEMAEYCDEDTVNQLKQGVNPIMFSNLQISQTTEESIAINTDPTPKVIISASGMCEAGRIRHHLKHNLWRPECTVLFVGFQVFGTVGRKLLDGADSIRLFGEDIAVKARIAQIDGFSSHADRDSLLQWLGHVECRQVFVNHGEDEVCESFAQLAEQTYHCSAASPFSGDVYDLATGECIHKATVTPVMSKKEAASQKARTVYDRLVSAGARLRHVIELNKGSSNRELAKFADQINSLCDKYQR